jgi:hypothetical protein
MFNPEERLFFKTAVMELFGFMNLRHFCHTEDVKNNHLSGLNILQSISMKNQMIFDIEN